MNNLWFDKELLPHIASVFNRNKMNDKIEAECNGAEGYCLLNLAQPELHQVLAKITRGIKIDSTGCMVAQLKGTEIMVDVCSIHRLEI